MASIFFSIPPSFLPRLPRDSIVKVKSLSRVRLLVTPWTVAYQLFCPWGFPGKTTGVGCHFFLQGIFPTQGSNPGLPHCRHALYYLSHQGSPRLPRDSIVEKVKKQPNKHETNLL